MAGRDPRRVLAVVGVTCAVLAVAAACAYWVWGLAAVLNRSQYAYYAGTDSDLVLDRAELAAARAEAARYGSWARASKVAGFAFGGIALGCAAFAAWRERYVWQEWPWPSLGCFFPALLALIAAAKHAALPIVLAVAALSLAAAILDVSRGKAGSPSRPLSWTVLAVSLLAILIGLFFSFR